MPLEEPSWWYEKRPGLVARGLAPIAGLYSWGLRARFALARTYRSRLPVLCAGNFTAGGSGKTPLTLHLCECVRALDKRPVVLSRGYGGRLQGPHWVKPDDHPRDTGDEPLLLSRSSPVVIARDRAAGARAIELSASADVIVMDDGLQNPQLHKDLAVSIVDGFRGFGNGRVIPAGPLRAPLTSQLALTHAIIVNTFAPGTGPETETWLSKNFDGPVLRCATVPSEDASWVRGQRVVAWAGIAGPGRFFGLLEKLGAFVVECFTFADHVSPTPEDAAHLMRTAQAAGAILVSTEKDLVRLAQQAGPLSELAAITRALPIRLMFDGQDGARLAALVSLAIK